VEQEAELGGDGVEAAGGDDERAGLGGGLVELGLDALHELGLPGDVKAVGTRRRARRRHGVAVQAEGPRAGEHDAGAGGERREGGRVGGVGDEDGHVLGRRRRGRGPAQRGRHAVPAAAGDREGAERGVGGGVEELESLADDVLAGEARGPEDDDVEHLRLRRRHGGRAWVWGRVAERWGRPTTRGVIRENDDSYSYRLPSTSSGGRGRS